MHTVTAFVTLLSARSGLRTRVLTDVFQVISSFKSIHQIYTR